jgi:hypothetical protein
MAITGAKPDDWAATNKFNLIVTHHPTDWLDADSVANWNSEIYPSGRFDLHLYGHMHEPSSSTIAYGGAQARRSAQAASLFGLDKLGDGTTVRINGYSANQIRDEDHERVITSWPRIEQLTVDKARTIVPDVRQNIDEDTGAVEMRWTAVRSAPPPAGADGSAMTPTVETEPLIATREFDLASIRHHIPESKAHAKVRRVELQGCLAALDEERAVWLMSDWGMGEDGFVSAIRAYHSIPVDSVFRLDLSSYENRQSFFDAARTRHGAGFEQICEAIAEAGAAILLLDAIELGRDRTAGEPGIARDIEGLIEIVRDFAPDALIIARTRRAAFAGLLTCIELHALDEADVAIYARESEAGGERYAKADAVGILFRHTDGIPSRLDVALRDLELVSLNDLLASNSDINEGGAIIVSAPAALVTTVNEIRYSEDEAERRSYRLLVALSALPQGERLEVVPEIRTGG